eukprot:6712366-Lingulodinium_polyedra.AAC.1
MGNVPGYVATGQAVLEQSAGWREAVAAVRQEWLDANGDRLQGVFEFSLPGRVAEDLLAYPCRVATEG